MTKTKVILSKDLLRNITWQQYKKRALKKKIRYWVVFILFFYLGVMSIGFLTRDSHIFVKTWWILPIWAIFLSLSILKSYLVTRSIDKGYAFDIKLDENGVTFIDEDTGEKRDFKSWEEYAYFIEHDTYIEVIDKNEKVSFLPKDNEIVLEFINRYIECSD